MPVPPRIHPLTGKPLEPIGFIDGRPVWPIMGASEAPPEGTPPAGDEGETDPPADGDKGGTEDKGGKGSKGGNLADEMSAEEHAALKAVREENAQLRIKVRDADKTTNDRLTKVAEALGIKVGKDEDPVKVAQAAAAEAEKGRDAAQAEVRSLRAEVIVWRNAAAMKVNAAVLTDSRSFERVVAQLDPEADDFEAKVKKAAQDAAKNNPALQAQAAAGKGGADFNGGTGEGAKRATSLGEAIAARMGV